MGKGDRVGKGVNLRYTVEPPNMGTPSSNQKPNKMATREANLLTVAKNCAPKVAFVRRFHCIRRPWRLGRMKRLEVI